MFGRILGEVLMAPVRVASKAVQVADEICGGGSIVGDVAEVVEDVADAAKNIAAGAVDDMLGE